MYDGPHQLPALVDARHTATQTSTTIVVSYICEERSATSPALGSFWAFGGEPFLSGVHGFVGAVDAADPAARAALAFVHLVFHDDDVFGTSLWLAQVIVQQIHSLRASGVMSCHTASIFLSA